MARLVVQSGHQSDICCDEIGPCAQNIWSILDAQFLAQLRGAFAMTWSGRKYSFDLL